MSGTFFQNQTSSPTVLDERWGGRLPFFLRHQDFVIAGDFVLFFERLAQRLNRLLVFNEAEIPNLDHFGAMLESESHQRFRQLPMQDLPAQMFSYFHPGTIQREIESRLQNDPEMEKASRLRIRAEASLPSLRDRLAENRSNRVPSKSKVEEAQKIYQETRRARFQFHFSGLVRERLTVLESLLQILPQESSAISHLTRDIRRFLAEAYIMLDVRGKPPVLVLMEELLLQREVVDPLLSRLSSIYPARANELIKAYHDVVRGVQLDSVFSEAFKSLEEIARSLTRDPSFVFDRSHMGKHFPKLHPAIHGTIIKLAGERGDAAGHGRRAPGAHEIRYLLFTVCNLALLLLDYHAPHPE